MASSTANYGFIKPDTGDLGWGPIMDSNLDAIDVAIHSAAGGNPGSGLPAATSFTEEMVANTWTGSGNLVAVKLATDDVALALMVDGEAFPRFLLTSGYMAFGDGSSDPVANNIYFGWGGGDFQIGDLHLYRQLLINGNVDTTLGLILNAANLTTRVKLETAIDGRLIVRETVDRVNAPVSIPRTVAFTARDYSVFEQNDLIASGTMEVMQFSGDMAALAIGLTGDTYPRWLFASNAADGLYLGDGTVDPYAAPGGSLFGNQNHIGIACGAAGLNLPKAADTTLTSGTGYSVQITTDTNITAVANGAINLGPGTDVDLVNSNATHGLILRSPNATKYRITVNNDGSLSTTVVP